LLPWLGRVDGSLSNGPANNSGLLMIVAGVVVLVAISALVLDGYGPTRWLVLLGGAIGLVDTVYEAFVKHNAHVGIGIWIALIGSIIVIIGSLTWRPARPSAGS
ncbi:MAG: hypothetical protein ACRDGQ_04830, partial [Candidatus Limnocylindrales bacterium]